MKPIRKTDFPVAEVRRFLEPGPVVLVSSAYKGERNIMTMGWHTVMEFTPALVGCVISSGNHSFELIRRSRQCVINVPTVDLASVVAQIGNCSGADTDKFATFKLTAEEADEVKAPLIGECNANLECKLHDGRLIDRYNFFIFEVVKAHAARTPKYPKTIHYRGEGQFMVSGRSLNLRRHFRPGML
ncbi:flavin reductase family protein [Pseudolabrys sp. FHR47]|uniref:flavin reductase family protein n=1 Tax=Pseudolabrys sp. FHR47 TaxID=2562284 RepID=UPI0010BF146E|nr:flavin reductase family protein [Pseudolabrys sp. FHR47]